MSQRRRDDEKKKAPAPAPATEYIYVGVCKHGMYYVGATEDPEARLAEHRAGTGSAWTHAYPMIKYVELKRKERAFEEQSKMYEYVRKYGWERVRGGTFTRMKPTRQQVEELMNVIRQEESACFACGELGHYISDCSRASAAPTRVHSSNARTAPTCYGCGEPGHYKPDCPVMNMRCSACGRDGHLKKVCAAAAAGRKPVVCYGCREPGHYKPDCPYQTTTCRGCGEKGHPTSGCALAHGDEKEAATAAATKAMAVSSSEKSILGVIGQWVYEFVKRK